jgi:hypothetical protein
LIESTLTAVTAYGSFILAEHLHFSGVLATVAAGLLIGNLGVLAEDERSRITPRGSDPRCAGHFRAAWLRLKQTDLIPGKGQFR